MLPTLFVIGWDQLYPYTSDLMCLDSCHPQSMSLPPQLTVVSTPLVVHAWERALQCHPDQAFARYILNGLVRGFRIGFNRKFPLQSAVANMGSALLHTKVVTDYLKKELSLGRMLGSSPPGFSTPELHINRFGIIPKGHDTGRWRLIIDLSFPPERSVNDGVDAESFAP